MSDEWEDVARRVLSFYVHEQLEEVESSTYGLMSAITGGDDVLAKQIHATRQALIDLQTVVEEDVTALVEDVEPYDAAFYDGLVSGSGERTEQERLQNGGSDGG